METFALKEMAILGCGYNGFSQLSPNSAKFSEWKVKEFKSIQLDLKPQEKILQCALSWSQIAFSTDQNRVIICGFNNSQLTMAECQVSALSLAIDSFQLLIATKEQDIHQWKKNVCQQVIWKDVTEKCKITQIQAGEMNCVGIREDGFPVEINQSQTDEDVFFACRPFPCKTKIKSVACGVEHVLMLSEFGSVLSYGIGSRGQTGLGTTERIQNAPQVIDALEGVKMIGIAAGNWHSAAISDFGDIYTWGWNESGQLGLPCPNFPDACSVSANNKSSDIERRDSVLIQALPHLVFLPGEEKGAIVIKVACGARHTAILSGDHHLLTCGWNAYGQLGHGDLVSRDCLTYVKQSCLSSCEDCIKVLDVFCGGWNTVVLTDISGFS